MGDIYRTRLPGSNSNSNSNSAAFSVHSMFVHVCHQKSPGHAAVRVAGEADERLILCSSLPAALRMPGRRHRHRDAACAKRLYRTVHIKPDAACFALLARKHSLLFCSGTLLKAAASCKSVSAVCPVAAGFSVNPLDCRVSIQHLRRINLAHIPYLNRYNLNDDRKTT